tara:strand:- start:2609 stop:2818 length:210 start_codon:yes stop_codon:yes gene_type:complete
MKTRRIVWDLSACDASVHVYLEAGSREEPPLMEIEKITSGNGDQDIRRLFNLEALEDLFWDQRPDLGDY